MLGLILLAQDNTYINYNGTLPKRPDWDKPLLSAFLKGQTVSYSAWKILPPSIQKIVKCSDIADSKAPVNIRELAKTDVLLVVRSTAKGNGKRFRLDKFECLTKNKECELWLRK